MRSVKIKRYIIMDRVTKRKIHMIHLERRERHFLRDVHNVHRSLDALFGLEFRPKVRFTER